MDRSVTNWIGVFIGVVVCSSCSSGSSGSTDAGVACGQTRCDASQVCCIDCEGHGTCGPSGSACPGYNCPNPDAGTGGASAGGASAGGSAGAGPACGSTVCASGMRCCDHCTSQCVSALSGQNCPDDNNPARTCSCGNSAQPCCQSTLLTCNSGLTCCTGQPYPSYGQCAVQCSLKSDYNAKTDFAPVGDTDVLERLDALPITTWRYTDDREGGRHMGPMAQEFRAAFELGASDKTIQVVDGLGVSMAAIQALSREVRSLRNDNMELRKRLSRVEARCSK